jgi:hypothetical protein
LLDINFANKERTMTATTATSMNYANRYGYSDIEPFEIVRRVSDRTIEIRRMDYARDESVKLEFIVGGFAAHCANQREQKWHITSNPEHAVIRIRLQKNGTWKDAGGNRYKLDAEPCRFYDYNF